MKMIYTLSLRSMTLLLALFLITYSSCKKEPTPEPTPPEPTAAEKSTALLIGAAWANKGVTVDGVVMDLYKGMAVTFTSDSPTAGKYTSVNGGAIWPASGTWRYKDETAKVMVREDNMEIAIDAITSTAMTISFTRTGETVFEPGRTKAVSGKHVMTMGR